MKLEHQKWQNKCVWSWEDRRSERLGRWKMYECLSPHFFSHHLEELRQLSSSEVVLFDLERGYWCSCPNSFGFNKLCGRYICTEFLPFLPCRLITRWFCVSKHYILLSNVCAKFHFPGSFKFINRFLIKYFTWHLFSGRVGTQTVLWDNDQLFVEFLDCFEHQNTFLACYASQYMSNLLVSWHSVLVSYF